MRIVLGFAGIPREIFDGFRLSHDRLVEPGDIIVSETYKKTDPAYYYGAHANFFLKEFARLLSEDHHNDLADTAFAVVYVGTHPGAERFARRFFPAVFCVPVTWKLGGYNRTTYGRSLADLNTSFRDAVHVVRRAVPPLKKELAEHDGRTPWLLPARNFRSDVLVHQLRSVHDRLRAGEDGQAVLNSARREFEQAHPLQRVGDRRKPCFVDMSKTEFHPPGSARHAFARGNFDGHPPLCLVSGRRRLGSPYDRAFHYDCAHGRGVLRGRFFGCHTDEQDLSGDPHLNIAPNDFVRR